jgi:hypothetical protein
MRLFFPPLAQVVAVHAAFIPREEVPLLSPGGCFAMRVSVTPTRPGKPRLVHYPALLFCFFGILTLASSTKANTITVTGLGDTLANDGVCTIREAVINANNDAATWIDCDAGSGADTINLPAGTITISIPNSPSSFTAEELSVTGDLDLTSSLTINGTPLPQPLTARRWIVFLISTLILTTTRLLRRLLSPSTLT